MNQRKRPVVRVGPRLAGLPPDEPTEVPATVADTPLRPKPLLIKCGVPECGQHILLPVGKPSIPFTCKKHRDLAPKKKVFVDDMFCLRHAKPHPCSRCEKLTQVWMKIAEQNREGHLLNQVLGTVRQTAWNQIAKQAEVFPVPEIGDWSKIDSKYDTEVYRHEINTGLRYAKTLLERDFPGWKTFDDLRQIAHIEVWLASKKYGEKMNGAIAYTIAKNQARRFLKDQIKEQTVAVENPDGSVALDEFGKPIKIPRFYFFDDKGVEEDGAPREISVAEESIAVEQEEQKKAWLDDIRRKIPLLEKLVASWFGAKRIVGQVLLEYPEATIRDFPGVPKSTAARVRQVVLAEFRAVVDSPLDERRVA